MGLLRGRTQLPVGVVWVQTQALPTQLWLKQPQKLYSPLLALLQSQDFSMLRLGPFMLLMYQPSVNWANLALAPKAVLQRLSPVAQLVTSIPLTGSVTVMMPPVQPSQKDWSGLAQGVKSGQQLQQGRLRTLGWMMQRSGSLCVQAVSPSWGLQPLQDILPTKLFFSSGQMVAVKVSPFLQAIACRKSEQNCWTGLLGVEAAAARPSSRQISKQLALAVIRINISKKQQRGRRIVMYTKVRVLARGRVGRVCGLLIQFCN